MPELTLPAELANLPNHGACPNPLTDVPVVVTGKSSDEISAAVVNIQEQDSAYYPTGVCRANGQDVLLFGKDPARRLAAVTSPEAARKLHTDLVKDILTTHLALLDARHKISLNQLRIKKAGEMLALARNQNVAGLEQFKALYREYVTETHTGRIVSSAAYAVMAFGLVTNTTEDLFRAAIFRGEGLATRFSSQYRSLYSRMAEMSHLQELQRADTSGCVVSLAGPAKDLAKAVAFRGAIGAGALASFGLMESALFGKPPYEIPAAILQDPEYAEIVSQDARLKNHQAYQAKLKVMSLAEKNAEYEKLTDELATLGLQLQLSEEGARYAENIFEILHRDPSKTESELKKFNLAVLDAIVADMSKKGIGGSSDEGIMRSLGLDELIGIGIGFGPGTKAFHRLWQTMPWHQGLNHVEQRLSGSARESAAHKYARLRSQQCRGDGSEQLEMVAAPAMAGVLELDAEPTLHRSAVRGRAFQPPLIPSFYPAFDPAAIPNAALVNGGWQSHAALAGQSVVSEPIFGQSKVPVSILSPAMNEVLQVRHYWGAQGFAEWDRFEQLFPEIRARVMTAYAHTPEQVASMSGAFARVYEVYTRAPVKSLPLMNAVRWGMGELVRAWEIGVLPAIDNLVKAIGSKGVYFGHMEKLEAQEVAARMAARGPVYGYADGEGAYGYQQMPIFFLPLPAVGAAGLFEFLFGGTAAESAATSGAIHGGRLILQHGHLYPKAAVHGGRLILQGAGAL